MDADELPEGWKTQPEEETAGGGPGDPGAVRLAGDSAEEIRLTAEFLTLAREDLAAAEGKAETGRPWHWLQEAGGLLAEAEKTQTRQRYEQALAYAAAAGTLAATAVLVLAQTIGAQHLPSLHLLDRNHKYHWSLEQEGMPPAEELYGELVEIYNSIVRHSNLVGLNTAAARYLAEALRAYVTANDAYQATNYPASRDAAALAQSLLWVHAWHKTAVGAPPPDTLTEQAIPD